MTIVAAKDSSVVCRIKLAGEGRWISLALSLGDLGSANRFLVAAERLLYEMAGLDEVAHQFSLVNWQGGVISGARYAFRTLKAPIQQVCLHELRGQLANGDVWAVSAAAALAVARLLARPDVPLDLGGWSMQEDCRTQCAQGINEGAKVVSPQPEPPPEQADNLPPASTKTDTNKGTQAVPAEPGTATDGHRDTGS